MLKEQKPKEVEQIKTRFQKAKSVVFAANRGLTVAQSTELRKKMKSQNSFYKVVKNRLVKRALKEAGITGLDSLLTGPNAIASSELDAVVPAKILVDFAKENEKLEIIGGFMDGAPLSLDQIRALASLPSREELYVKVLRCLNGVAGGLVNVLAAVPRNLVQVMDAVRRQKQES